MNFLEALRKEPVAFSVAMLLISISIYFLAVLKGVSCSQYELLRLEVEQVHEHRTTAQEHFRETRLMAGLPEPMPSATPRTYDEVIEQRKPFGC